jgi:hypothetical protein
MYIRLAAALAIPHWSYLADPSVPREHQQQAWTPQPLTQAFGVWWQQHPA